MKIEDGKTWSDVLAGCPPIDWLKQIGENFKYAWTQTVADVRSLWEDFGYGVRGVWEGIRSGFSQVWEWQKNIPVIGDAIKGVDYGIGLVKKTWNSLTPCWKTIIVGTAAAAGAVVAIGGGIYALAAIAGWMGGSLLANIGITVTAGTLLSLFITGTRSLWNFNWNISDSQIEAQFKSKMITLSGRTGEILGTTLGGVICGWGLGTAIAYFNPSLAAKIKRIMPEVWEEILEEYKPFFGYVARLTLSSIMMSSFKTVRSWIKNSVKLMPFLGSKFQKAVESWGAEGSKPWSFASAFRESYENISNPFLQAFVEELAEEGLDSCDNNAYLVAAGLSY